MMMTVIDVCLAGNPFSFLEFLAPFFSILGHFFSFSISFFYASLHSLPLLHLHQQRAGVGDIAFHLHLHLHQIYK